MALLYPDTPTPRTIELTFEHPVIVNKTKSGRHQTSPDGPSFLRFSLEYNRGVRRDDDELRKVWSFLAACNGQLREFDVHLGRFSDGQGYTNNGGTVQAAASAGFEVKTTGWQSGKLIRRAGDFVQFGNNPKAYMLADDAVGDAIGMCTFKLCTPLIASIPPTTSVKIHNILFRMRLGLSTASIINEPGLIQSIRTIDMEEVISA